MKQAESGRIQALNEPVISENANENENNQNSVTDAVARDEICLSKSRSNVRSVISQISDINSEEESFHSNPSSSSFTSTITSPKFMSLNQVLLFFLYIYFGILENQDKFILPFISMFFLGG